MTDLQIHQFACLSDNYGVLVHDPKAEVTASIDAPEEGAIFDALDEMGWSLTHILNTHHHADHTQANAALKEATGCLIAGPKGEASKIPEIDVELAEGDNFEFGGHSAQIIETPGHTLGHIAFHFAQDHVAFVGDTLFPLGCGRVFEGTMEQMWSSMEKLAALPPDTRIYCGHEYTQANARFALTVEPGNKFLRDRSAEIDVMRANGMMTVPTTIAQELATNPFLRAENATRFAEIRNAKDNF